MTKKEKEAILQFMRLTLYQFHPHFGEYPIQNMKLVEYSNGEEFENTKYENSTYLQQAYYMNKAIKELERSKS